MKKHLIFYDGQCGLCDFCVQFILNRDSKKNFLFAPLEGSTAKNIPSLLNFPLEKFDTLILIENYQGEEEEKHILGKAALRTCWLLGGIWALPGLISWLPAFLYDWIYRFVAKSRHRFFKKSKCSIDFKKYKECFLP